jgi:hypothetical protein
MASLKKFSGGDIIISKEDGVKILRFFFPVDAGSVSAESLSEVHVSFAQALLVEAIDATYAMGFAEAMFKSFFGKTPMSFASVAKLVGSFCGRAAKNWFSNEIRRRPGKIPPVDIYEMVRTTLARNFKSEWIMLRDGIIENY